MSKATVVPPAKVVKLNDSVTDRCRFRVLDAFSAAENHGLRGVDETVSDETRKARLMGGSRRLAVYIWSYVRENRPLGAASLTAAGMR